MRCLGSLHRKLDRPVKDVISILYTSTGNIAFHPYGEILRYYGITPEGICDIVLKELNRTGDEIKV